MIEWHSGVVFGSGPLSVLTFCDEVQFFADKRVSLSAVDRSACRALSRSFHLEIVPFFALRSPMLGCSDIALVGLRASLSSLLTVLSIEQDHLLKASNPKILDFCP